MNAPLTVAMAQLNLWVGDIDGNVDKIIEAAGIARDHHGADLVVFPEMAILGYPPDDLLLRRGLPAAVGIGLERIRETVDGIAVVVGYPEYVGPDIYNAAAVFRDGERIGGYRKQCLPNYGVFDERRHYRPGDRPCVIEVAGTRVGVTICEDIWEPGPARQAADAGARVLVNLNASPYHLGKRAEREKVLGARARDNQLPIVYVNCVGGQDELVFDGRSMVHDAAGGLAACAPAFREGVFPVRFENGRPVGGEIADTTADEALTYEAVVQATRDYVDRNGFAGALVGLSGGIDSALTLAVAVDALGADRVWGVGMPSRYTAAISNEEAAAQAELLGVRYDELPIEPMFERYLDTLGDLFAGREPDATEENLQSRIRGALLMALSNKFHHLVLATGNKSEMAVGYATLYGDMCGGFAPLKDVYKSWVYRLSEYRNTVSPAIPRRVIERPPSAELRADQADTDTLPPYDELDPIIEAYVEDGRSIDEICELGYGEETVRKVAGLIRRAEYKRRQAAPGPKVTRRAFGRDRRYPITAVYGDL
ncbi:NAD(+) synthetase [Salinisphaera sp. PC39]|uniref:NAD+ synthase n=1 Tax=Salinisphaera sp. PC39 TaxID=1304156 RepID=UPI003340D367